MLGRLWHLIRRGLARLRWPLAGLAALALVLACVLVVPQRLVQWELGAAARDLKASERAKAINDVRTTLLQGVGGAVLLLGAYFTYRQLQTGRDQLQIAQHGQVTERFTRAIDQLGKAELDVRIGGIYALERIANDSPGDRPTIIEVLTAFIRGHAPWPPRGDSQPPTDAPIDQVPEMQARAPDVHAALTVLARRKPPTTPTDRLDLHNTDLRKAILNGADLKEALLQGTQLQEANLLFTEFQKAILSRAGLQGALLHGADLQEAHLSSAQLQKAGLSQAHLEKADLLGAYLEKADLSEAHLQEADLSYAHLQGANLQGANLHGAELRYAHADAETVWPSGFDPGRAGVQGQPWTKITTHE